MADNDEFEKIEKLSRVISFLMTYYRPILFVLACCILVSGLASWLEQQFEPKVALFVALFSVGVAGVVFAIPAAIKHLKKHEDSNFTPFS